MDAENHQSGGSETPGFDPSPRPSQRSLNRSHRVGSEGSEERRVSRPNTQIHLGYLLNETGCGMLLGERYNLLDEAEEGFRHIKLLRFPR
jgi:hypothetical protein